MTARLAPRSVSQPAGRGYHPRKPPPRRTHPKSRPFLFNGTPFTRVVFVGTTPPNPYPYPTRPTPTTARAAPRHKNISIQIRARFAATFDTPFTRLRAEVSLGKVQLLLFYFRLHK